MERPTRQRHDLLVAIKGLDGESMMNCSLHSSFLRMDQSRKKQIIHRMVTSLRVTSGCDLSEMGPSQRNRNKGQLSQAGSAFPLYQFRARTWPNGSIESSVGPTP